MPRLSLIPSHKTKAPAAFSLAKQHTDDGEVVPWPWMRFPHWCRRSLGKGSGPPRSFTQPRPPSPSVTWRSAGAPVAAPKPEDRLTYAPGAPSLPGRETGGGGHQQRWATGGFCAGAVRTSGVSSVILQRFDVPGLARVDSDSHLCIGTDKRLPTCQKQSSSPSSTYPPPAPALAPSNQKSENTLNVWSWISPRTGHTYQQDYV